MLREADKALWPDFFIIGAPKAGTTSLFHFLRKQPGVFLPTIKEPHFFSRGMAARLQMSHVSSEADYLGLFGDADALHVRGEASTTYLRDPEAPGRLHQSVPDARIIVLLRDPVERAFSHYLMLLRGGGLRATFSEGVAGLARDHPDVEVFRQLVIEPGFYGTQLARYFSLFGPEQVKVVISEEFFAAPGKTVVEILSFLGLDGVPVSDGLERQNHYLAPRGPLMMLLLRRKKHLRFLRPVIPAQLKWRIVRAVFNKPGEKPLLPPEARSQLQALYAEDTAALRRLLKRPGLWQ